MLARMRSLTIPAACGLAALGLIAVWLLAGGDGEPTLSDAAEDDPATATTTTDEAASNVESDDAVEGAADSGTSRASVDLSDSACLAALEAELDLPSGDSESPAEEEAADRAFEAARAALAASSDPEHQLAAALNTGVDSRAAVFGEMALPDTSRPLLLWHYLLLCRKTEREDCPVEDLEARLLAVDSANGEAWMLVATGRYDRGDRDGALAAMQQAGAAAESNSYWDETVGMIDRALVATGGFDPRDRLVSAVGAAVTALPDWGEISTICREESARNPEWAQACADYGALTELRNEGTLGQMVAGNIRVQAVRNLGDEGRAAMLEAESRQREARRSRHRTIVNLLIQSDPVYAARYLDVLLVEGEPGVSERFLLAELPPLLDRLDVDPACMAVFMGDLPGL